MKYKQDDRVTFPDMPFLSNGRIASVINGFGYTVKLDEKAPNEYAWDTDKIIAFDDMIAAEGDSDD